LTDLTLDIPTDHYLLPLSTCHIRVQNRPLIPVSKLFSRQFGPP